jgi:hypothetical protein
MLGGTRGKRHSIGVEAAALSGRGEKNGRLFSFTLRGGVIGGTAGRGEKKVSLFTGARDGPTGSDDGAFTKRFECG